MFKCILGMRFIVVALWLFVFIFKNVYALEKNPFCIDRLTGVIVKVVDGGLGYVSLTSGDDIDNGIVALTIVDDDNYPIYEGMRLPHKKNLCFTYVGDQSTLELRDGKMCRMRMYQIEGRYIGSNFLSYLKKLANLNRETITYFERNYEHCGTWKNIKYNMRNGY